MLRIDLPALLPPLLALVAGLLGGASGHAGWQGTVQPQAVFEAARTGLERAALGEWAARKAIAVLDDQLAQARASKQRAWALLQECRDAAAP